MYDSLTCNCKVLINIKGGGHCYFADANFLCSLGEIGCPPFTITREEQHATTLDFTTLFLDYHLKNQVSSWIAFNDSLNSSPRITFQKSCTTTSIRPDIQEFPFLVSPNPSGGSASLSGKCTGNEQIFVVVKDTHGKMIHHATIKPAEDHYCMPLDMNAWAAGVYFAEIRSSEKSRVVKIVKY